MHDIILIVSKSKGEVMMSRLVNRHMKTPAKPKYAGRAPQDIIKELNSIKANIKLLEEREAKLKAEIVSAVEFMGVKDSKGSMIMKVGDWVAKKEARKTYKLDQERAENLFREIGIWDFVSESKEVINNDYVEQAVLQKKLTMAQLKSVTDEKIVFATVVKPYKPDEEEGII